MGKKDVKENLVIIYLALLSIVIVIIILLILRASFNFHSFEQYKDYFKENKNPIISDWMTPHTILRHFNITEKVLFSEMNLTKNEELMRTPLYRTCTKKKIDCKELVKKLNEIKA